MKDFDTRQENFINSGKICVIGVISPTTGLPHLTPTGVICCSNKLYIGVITDTAKYKFIKKGNNKVGVTIIDPNVFLSAKPGAYLSVSGIAKILEKESFANFEEMVRKLLETDPNDPNKEKVEERLLAIIKAGNWVLIELTPEKIFSLKARGGF